MSVERNDPMGEGRFEPDVLDDSVLAVPLLRDLDKAEKDKNSTPIPVVIDLNLAYGSGRRRARNRARDLIKESVDAAATSPESGESQQQVLDDAEDDELEGEGGQYLYARLEPAVIRELARRVGAEGEDESVPGSDPEAGRGRRCIYRIWPDFPLNALINRSTSTVKADAARVSFSAFGAGIVWAIVDSGVDPGHVHFRPYENLTLPPPLRHRDFVTNTYGDEALRDGLGHGTHVAGILAGGARTKDNDGKPLCAVTRYRNESGEIALRTMTFDELTGMAPKCKILSLRVLDDQGQGRSSRLLAALQYINRINAYGRRLRVHGVNLSVGYGFEPEWFACGQSLVCVEVDHLVRSGVVVVAAAGNTGYTHARDEKGRVAPAGVALTINDPGNAEEAITVGSTHRFMPHVYGVSYFSSKGPTGDGRPKPDLIAPGEKIISAYAGMPQGHGYAERSGTSMAAPHVSGVIAAFLSVRPEFIGRPQAVKKIFLSTATDLKRERSFQGHGLVDLMRAIQSV
jgi:hypothetical protein